MANERLRTWRFPSLVLCTATALVIGGFLLSGISWWFLLLSGLGAFGPGVLRELGLLRDKDEFQVQAARRAGYHAFLATGLTAFLLVAALRATEQTIRDPEELSTFLLAVLGFTWILSSLLGYWGAKKGARIVLYVLGTCWLIFIVASNTGQEWGGIGQLLISSLIALPFFILAVLSRFYPRIAGALLLLASAGFMEFFGFFRQEEFSIVTQAITFLMFIGPLLGAGFALVASPKVDDDDSESEFEDANPGSNPAKPSKLTNQMT